MRLSPCDEPRPAGALSAETRVVAFNPAKDDPHGSATMPLYQTATFAQPSATEFGAYDYTRSGNPAVFSDLEIASVGDAKHILLVSPGETGEGDVTPPGR